MRKKKLLLSLQFSIVNYAPYYVTHPHHKALEERQQKNTYQKHT